MWVLIVSNYDPKSSHSTDLAPRFIIVVLLRSSFTWVGPRAQSGNILELSMKDFVVSF